MKNNTLHLTITLTGLLAAVGSIAEGAASNGTTLLDADVATNQSMARASTSAFGSHGQAVLVLSDNERDSVKKIIDTFPILADPYAIDNSTLFNLIQVAQRLLPERLIRAMVEFRRTPNPAGTLIVRNMPTDPVLPNTPADGMPSKEKRTRYSEYSLLLITLFLGEPIT